MNKVKMVILVVMSTCYVLLMGGGFVVASEYPNRPITLIVPHAPGGSTDLTARSFANLAEKFLKQSVAVVNKTGASGMIGTEELANAASDGYTLGMGLTHTVSTIEYEIVNGRKPAVTRDDFTLLGALSLTPNLIAVPYDSPWKSLNDLIRDCKSKPSHYTLGHGGMYGISHVPAILLQRVAGFKVREIPFKGGQPALSATVGGHVDFSVVYPPTVMALYRGKKVRLLVVQGAERLDSLPDVPSIKELGIDAQFYSWLGIMAPDGLPTKIAEKLREVVKEVAHDELFIETFEKMGEKVRYLNAQQLDEQWARESKLFKEIFQSIKE